MSQIVEYFSSLELSACPACASHDRQEFIERTSELSNRFTHSGCTYRFESQWIFCGKCGHIYNRNPPSDSWLAAYYADLIAHTSEDYSFDVRLDVMRRYLNDAGRSLSDATVLDFGSNSRLDFHSVLDGLCSSLSVYDVIYDDGAGVLPKSFDLITAYFVLEHVVDLASMMQNLRDRLTSRGTLIIEVPVTDEYNQDSSGLLYEHQHHFSANSLQRLAERQGMRVLYCGKGLCSRDMGYVLVATVAANDGIDCTSITSNSGDISACLVNYKIARQHANKVLEWIAAILSFLVALDDAGVKIFVWGVNTHYLALFSGGNCDVPAIAIDSDLAKAAWVLDGHGYFSSFPTEVWSASVRKVLLVLAPYYSAEILRATKLPDLSLIHI